MPGASLVPETAKVIYASKKQLWIKVVPTDEERTLLGDLEIRRNRWNGRNPVEDIYKTIGENIRQRRLVSKLSYVKLAEMMHYKDGSSIANIERGIQTLAVHQLIAFADIFECSINDFLENEAKP
jgi:ribosome-binding protein aMBF1 (putative translation factor)